MLQPLCVIGVENRISINPTTNIMDTRYDNKGFIVIMFAACIFKEPNHSQRFKTPKIRRPKNLVYVTRWNDRLWQLGSRSKLEKQHIQGLSLRPRHSETPLLVHFQIKLIVKAHSTSGADVVFLARVHGGHVAIEVVFRSEALLTVATFVWVAAEMCVEVALEVGEPQHSITDVALCLLLRYLHLQRHRKAQMTSG